jgi:hypothetical protein
MCTWALAWALVKTKDCEDWGMLVIVSILLGVLAILVDAIMVLSLIERIL